MLTYRGELEEALERKEEDMEKFYIVVNEKFLKEIEDYKESMEKRNGFIKDFFERNRISGSGYCISGDGLVNCPFEEQDKECIRLYIEDCDENNENYGRQLLRRKDFGGHRLRSFRKGSALLKAFQNECVEKKIVINSRFHREGDYFKELRLGGYSTTRFELDGKYYLRMGTVGSTSITPAYDGFEEIKGSEFYKALERFEERDSKKQCE